MLFIVFRRDHLLSTLGTICGLGSFALLYFFGPIKEFERHHLGFLWTMKWGIRDSHVTKVLANLTERNGSTLKLRAITYWNIFQFSFFSFLSSFVMFLFCFNLFVVCVFFFCFVFFFNFRYGTSLFLFNLILENLILQIFLITIVNIRYSGMSRNVAEYSGMFHVPGFIDGPFFHIGINKRFSFN